MSWGYKRQPEDGSWMEFIDVDVCEISGSKFAGNMSDCWKPTWISWAKRESRTIKSVSAFRDHSGHIPTNHGRWVAFFCELHSKSWPCCEAWAPACSVSATGCNACDDERLGKDQWVEGGLGYVAIAVCWISGKKVNFLVFTKLRSRTLKVLSEKATEQKETLSQLRQQADQARTDVKTCKAWFGSVFVHCCVVSFCFLVVVF